MRTDMDKVTTERPRSGGGIKQPKGEKKNLKNLEDSPSREKIRAKWKRTMCEKQFTDVIGPLYRFLLKNVGRPWNKVYSEVSANLPKTSVQSIHIHSHIWGFVEKNVIMINGEPCYADSRLYGSPLTTYGRFAQLYINPATGLLCKVKKKHVRQTGRKENYNPGVKGYKGVQFHNIGGIWYEVKVIRYVDSSLLGGSINDKILNRYYHDIKELEKVYGGQYIAESKRQLSKREIKLWGLT